MHRYPKLCDCSSHLQFLRQESSRVSNALNQMKAALDEQEQYIRRDCLEIRGVPTSSSEDTNEIVKNIGSLVDVCIEDKDISISHRIKSGTSVISPIIVKFTRRGVRDDLYKARTKLKNITSGNLGLGRQGENKIFIQESLTSSRKANLIYTFLVLPSGITWMKN